MFDIYMFLHLFHFQTLLDFLFLFQKVRTMAENLQIEGMRHSPILSYAG